MMRTSYLAAIAVSLFATAVAGASPGTDDVFWACRQPGQEHYCDGLAGWNGGSGTPAGASNPPAVVGNAQVPTTSSSPLAGATSAPLAGAVSAPVDAAPSSAPVDAAPSSAPIDGTGDAGASGSGSNGGSDLSGGASSEASGGSADASATDSDSSDASDASATESDNPIATGSSESPQLALPSDPVDKGSKGSNGASSIRLAFSAMLLLPAVVFFYF